MYHKIFIIGNLGKDPEQRFTPSGQAVTSFSVAVDNSYTKDGERVKRTIWVNVSAWGKLAETCKNYLAKGKKVLIEGTLTADPETGNPRVFTRGDGTSGAAYEVNAQTVRFLSSKGEAEADEEVPF